MTPNHEFRRLIRSSAGSEMHESPFTGGQIQLQVHLESLPLQVQLGQPPDALDIFTSSFLVHWRLEIEVRELGISP